MIHKDDIDKLSNLSRIAISEEERDTFFTEIDAIFSYVSHIEKVSSETKGNALVGSTNILRSDDTPHETGLFTDKILRAAPATQDGFIRVKKILPS